MPISGKFIADFSAFNAEVQKSKAELKGFELQAQGAAASADRIGASSSIATTGVGQLATATATLAESQSLATLSTAQLDAMIAGEVVALGTVTAATTTAAAASGAYGSVIFATAEAEVAATVATGGFTASLAGAATMITGLVATIAPWLLALGIAIKYLEDYIEAQGKAALAAEEQGAKQDVINKALSLGAKAGISYADAVKFVNAEEQHRLALFPEVAAQKYIDKLSDQAKASMRASAEQEALNEGLAAHGIVIGETIDVQKLMTEARKKDADEAKKQKQEQERLAEANQRFRDSVKNLTSDAVGAAKGLGVYGALMPDLSSNTAQFADQTIVLHSALDSTKKDMEALQRSGQFLSAAMVGVNQQFGRLPNVSSQAAAAIKQVNDEAARGHNLLTGLSDGLQSLWKGMSGGKGIGGLFENLGKGVIDQFGSLISGGISSLVAKGLGLLETGIKRLFGGPSGAELAGRKVESDFESQFKSFDEMVNKIGAAYAATGKTFEQARADVNALIAAEKQGGDAVQAVIDKIQESLDAAAHQADLLAEASSKYGPSQTDLENTEKHLHELFDAMTQAGTYSADQLNAAYYAWQKAMADAGNEAAAAWVKAHDAAEKGAQTADSAMQKLIARRDELNTSIAKEAWEPEIGINERRDIEERDRLNQQIADAEKAASDTEDIYKDHADEWAKYVEERAGKAADEVRDSFDFTIHIPVAFDVGGLPVVPMAGGGDFIVSKPTLFLAGEGGTERATFTPAGKASPTSGSTEMLEVLYAIQAAVEANRVQSIQIDGREVILARQALLERRGALVTAERELLGLE